MIYFDGTASVDEVVLKTEFKNLWMIPATIQLAGIDIELIEKSKVSPGFRKAYQLKEHMEGVKEKYDYIIIDCPPSLGMINNKCFNSK